jgi:hypothetical protein
VDADELPGAVRPSGTYTVEGETVKVTLVLERDGQVVATVPVEGSKGDLAGLVGGMTAAIAGAL